MNSAIERLLMLRAADVMSKNLVQLSARDSMTKAAEVMIHHHVTGAPVVNEVGQCIGVLSATDFLRHEQVGGDDDLVRAYMSPGVKIASPITSLVDVARVMCKYHLHRVMVLDHGERLVGVVSSLDIVAALIKAVEE